jgi:hypothetical protein
MKYALVEMVNSINQTVNTVCGAKIGEDFLSIRVEKTS